MSRKFWPKHALTACLTCSVLCSLANVADAGQHCGNVTGAAHGESDAHHHCEDGVHNQSNLGTHNHSEHGAHQEDHTLHSGHDAQHHEAHHHEALIFLFIGVALGTAVLLITTHPKLHKLQFTVVMFVLGLFFALVAEIPGMGETGMLIRSIETWQSPDPHLLLFVFLPPLLFGDASIIDTHVAKRCAWQFMLLAGPGVVIGSLLTALFLYYQVPWGWNFSTSLTVGSILAATDPVAVVGLLKELGASPSLTITIQGESLLNDGTAVVLFNVAYKMASGENLSVGYIFTYLLKAVFGSVVIGLVVGLVSLWVISKAKSKLDHNNPITQICVTICCAYWSFILAEIFEESGVLSTVTASLVLAHRMWPLLVSSEAMLEIWHVIEVLGNTLVFFTAGILTGHCLIHNVTFVDGLWLLYLYVVITLIRFSMLVCFWPILNSISQHKLSMKDILVITWGGLRGMVGLAFAMLVRMDLADGRLSQEDGDRVLFLVGGIAALTLIVNATTCPSLVKGLGITRVPEGRKALVRNVAKRARNHVEGLKAQMIDDAPPGFYSLGTMKLCLDRIYHEVDHHVLAHGNTLFETPKHSAFPTAFMNWFFREVDPVAPDVNALWEKFECGKQRVLNSGANIVKFKFGQQLSSMRMMLKGRAVNPAQLKIVREVFLTAVNLSYWEQLKMGKLYADDDSLIFLVNSTKLAQESSDRGLLDWELLKSTVPVLQPNNNMVWKDAATDVRYLKRIINKCLKKDTFEEQTQAFTIVNSYIEAHVHAQSQTAIFFGDDHTVDTPEEAFVIIESQCNVFEAASLCALLSKDAQKRVNTMMSIHKLSESYRNFIITTMNSGVLQSDEAAQLLDPLRHEMAKISKEKKQIWKSRRRSVQNTTRRSKRQLTDDEAARIIQKFYYSYFFSCNDEVLQNVSIMKAKLANVK